MAAQLGTATVLKIGSDTIAKGRTLSMSRSTNMVDVTNKDSSGRSQEVLPGLMTGSYQFEGVFDEDATYGWDNLWDAQTAGTLLTAKFGTGVTGDKTYSYSCYVSSLDRSAPNLDVEVFTCTLTFTGACTEATNP